MVPCTKKGGKERTASGSLEMNPAVKNTPKKTSKNEAVSKDIDNEAKDTDSSGKELNEDEVNTTTPAIASDNEDSSDEDAAGFIKLELNDTVTFPPVTKVAINTVYTAISVDDSMDLANVCTNLRVALYEYPFEHETLPESNPDLTVWALIKATAKCSSKGLCYLILNVCKPDGLLLGFDAAVACMKCKSKTGPFREFIVKSEDDGTYACGNCVWGHGKVKKCSLVDVDPDDDAEVSVTPAASTTSIPVKTPWGTKRKGVYGDLG
ncbi:hypothetical protein H9Q70_012924 [Fusarium xylarioides]|nr:hypothetical protein H9Q70_012924 [Fusarium xylarioides]